MPRINAENLAEHRTLMEGRLLDALGDLLHERGYAAITLADVAARAGMARSSVYGYAADKQALLMAYVDRSVDRFVEETRQEMAAVDGAPARLQVLVRRQMEQFRAEPGAGGDGGMLDGAALGPDGHERLMHRFRPLHALLREVVAEGVAEGTFRPVDVDAVVPLVFACFGAERVAIGTGVVTPAGAGAAVGDFVLHALEA